MRLSSVELTENQDYSDSESPGLDWTQGRVLWNVISLAHFVIRKQCLDCKFFIRSSDVVRILKYDLNFLKLYVQTKQRGKKKSMQSVLKKPIYSHQIPTKITGGAKASFVVAYDKFSMAKDKRLLIDLNEANGERHIDLKVNSRVVNLKSPYRK